MPSRGYLSLVLHAHLPYVRHPEHEQSLEERWLFEAISECYLPLIAILDQQYRDGIKGKITLGITPPLIAMLGDPFLQSRFFNHLNQLIELNSNEVVRLSQQEHFGETARFLLERYRGLRENYQRLGGDLLQAFRRIQERGQIELIASGATHGYLPFLKEFPESVHAQIQLGVESYQRAFGKHPRGFWIPECAYFEGLESYLKTYDLEYFFLETHGVRAALPRIEQAELAPLRCGNGLFAFGRDPITSQLVWSSEVGYPGHEDYREFHRDAGYVLPNEVLGPLQAPPDGRAPVGLKYHRITGPTEVKEPYVRRYALERLNEHAQDFVDRLSSRLNGTFPKESIPPIFVAPYDAELFGHWWFEGPEWIDRVIRKIEQNSAGLEMVSPGEYLTRHPEQTTAQPVESSWGQGGFHAYWLNENNQSMREITREAHERLRDLAELLQGILNSDAYVVAAYSRLWRQLLLLSASDWPFLVSSGTAGGYAQKRFQSHWERFQRLEELLLLYSEEIEKNPVSIRQMLKTCLEEVDAMDGLFPWLDGTQFEPQKFSESERLRNPEMKKHIVFLSAEATPFAKAGGLGDVCGALPQALAAEGQDVTLILPAYGFLDREKFKMQTKWEGLSIFFEGAPKAFDVLEAESSHEGVRLLFVDFPWFFNREGIYVDPQTGEEYHDSAARFLFFSKACLESLCHLGQRVDVLHCHDHQTAMALGLLRIQYEGHPVFEQTAGIFTLHNLGYQGTYGPDILDKVEIHRDWYYPLSPFEFYGNVNLMKIGISLADKVNAVSERYAREVTEGPEAGAGLQEVLKDRGPDLVGILNGIDVEEWNPATDPHLPENFSVEDIAGKRECKLRLLEEMGLNPEHVDSVPLIGMVTRLVDQKGLDIFQEALDQIMSLGVDIVVLGTGLPKYHHFLEEAQNHYRGRIGVALQFDNGLAHRIEAGSDFFLMPSLYEPCGLNQMYSLRYGAIPIVRETGGLADTVPDFDANPDCGLGFSFKDYNSQACFDACRRAVEAYHQPERIQALRDRAMRVDNSWGSSAKKYLALYEEALQRRRSTFREAEAGAF